MALLILIMQVALRFVNQFVFGYPALEVVGITELCLLALVVTTSYRQVLSVPAVPSTAGFPKLYKRKR